MKIVPILTSFLKRMGQNIVKQNTEKKTGLGDIKNLGITTQPSIPISFSKRIDNSCSLPNRQFHQLQWCHFHQTRLDSVI